jgi:hypothetical protein
MLALVGAVRGLPAAPQQKVLTQDHLSLQRALEGSGVGCRGENMQKACPGYSNVMMFCCGQADNRKSHDKMCTRFNNNAAVCGVAAQMESVLQTCCEYEWSNNASLLFGHKIRLDIPGDFEEWEDWDLDDEVPIAVVGEDGDMSSPEDPDGAPDPISVGVDGGPAPVVDDRKMMPPGTCNATNEALQSNDAAQEQWDKWCDQNCIPEKYGGVGTTACKSGTGTGAIGCVCKQGVKAIAVATVDPADLDDPFSAGAPSAGFVPEDASTCISTTLSATDNWCADSCGEGNCPNEVCICDAEAKKVTDKAEADEKEAQAEGKPGKNRKETPEEAEARKRVEEADAAIAEQNKAAAAAAAEAARAAESAPAFTPNEQNASATVSQVDDIIAQAEKDREAAEAKKQAADQKKIDANEEARKEEEAARLADINKAGGVGQDPLENARASGSLPDDSSSDDSSDHEGVKEEVKEEVKLGPGEHTMEDGHVHNPPPDADADPSV